MRNDSGMTGIKVIRESAIKICSRKNPAIFVICRASERIVQ
jgi:hypothetical protein